MKYKIDENYKLEKIEVYNVAISALELHEAADEAIGDEITPGLGKYLRNQLIKRLNSEINRWLSANM